MEVLEKANKMEQEGHHIIHLEVGEPDFDLPNAVKRRSEEAVNQGHSHYTHSLGNLELRKAIAAFHEKKYSTPVNPDNVIVTSGSSPAILLILAALINPGDEVMVSNPGYSCYTNFIRIVHGKTVHVPVSADNGFQFDVNVIKKLVTPRTKAIIINSPMNPTGNLLSPQVMRDMADLGITIISDEIYHGLVYNDMPHSILEFTDNAFVVSGFSKTWAMTGLRLGYCICPNEYVRPIQKLQQNLFICADSVSQQCGIAALQECDEDVDSMKKIYNERRVYMIKRLKDMGFKIPFEPTGAFYVFVDCRHISNDSYSLAFDILEKAHIGVTPGVDFGSNGEGFIRFSYANSIENIAEGLDRFENYIREVKPKK